MLYKEQKQEGEISQYRRASSGYFYNSEAPSITFNEDDITVLPDGQVFTKEGVGKVTATLENPTEEFDLINPQTGESIGKATKQQVFVLLYSLYLAEAKKRDEQLSEIPV